MLEARHDRQANVSAATITSLRRKSGQRLEHGQWMCVAADAILKRPAHDPSRDERQRDERSSASSTMRESEVPAASCARSRSAGPIPYPRQWRTLGPLG